MGHKFSKILSKVVTPCTIAVGKINPCCKKEMKNHTLDLLEFELIKTLKPGDFILSFISNRPTNLFIQGAPYTHLGIVSDNNNIIDMVSKGIRESSLRNWIKNKSKILVLRIPILTDKQTNQIVKFAKISLENKVPYDFSFQIGDDAMYCTEFGYLALRSISNDLPIKLGIIPSIQNGIVHSTLFKANSFIKPIKDKNIVAVLEWRLEMELKDIYNIDITRLLNEIEFPENVSEISLTLMEMTKLAFPFNDSRTMMIKQSMELEHIKHLIYKNKTKRNELNTFPNGDLINISNKITNNLYEVFQDEKTLEIYIIVSQISNLFHCPCKYTKLVSYDAVHGFPEALGSSEIFIPNSYRSSLRIPNSVIKKGSYNYRDLKISGRIDHFLADILLMCF